MKLRIVQIKSRISEVPKAKRTLDALGLRRNYRSVVHEDTPQLRGMLRGIAHLVRTEEVPAGQQEGSEPRKAKATQAAPPAPEPAASKPESPDEAQ